MDKQKYKAPEQYISGLGAEFDFADIIGGAGPSGEAGVIGEGEDFVY